MAHPCISCGSECYCSGDIDDIIVSHTPMSCIGCDWCEEDDDEYLFDYEEEYDYLQSEQWKNPDSQIQ